MTVVGVALEDRLRALIAHHCDTLRGEAAAVAGALAGWAADTPPSTVALLEAAAAAHKIKGSSGTIGFHGVSDLAKALDDHLRGLARAGAQASVADCERAVELNTRLQAAVATLRPEHSVLFDQGFLR